MWNAICTSKKKILKHAKMKRIIKREPTFKYESQQTHEPHEWQQTHESQILRNEPQILRNESQIHRNKPQQTHESQQTHEPQILRNELQLKKWLRLQKCFLMILHTNNFYVHILKRNMYLKVYLYWRQNKRQWKVVRKVLLRKMLKRNLYQMMLFR